MAYGKIKADTLVYDNSGSDTEVTISSLGNKVDAADPTFTGTVTIPTPAANDNTTKAASTAYVQTELGDYAALAGATFTGNVVMSANLTVQGTTTTISSTTIEVADKNLELGKVDTPTDITADGGGITLKGASDKTFNWVNSNGAWTSSENIKLGDDKKLIAGTGSDFQIYHDGTHNRIDSTNGMIYLRHGTDNALKTVPNGTVELYYDDSKKLETTAAGVTVTGTVTDSKGNVRSIPQNAPSSAYTLAASDAGKHVIANGHTITLPDNTFSEGDAITVINNHSSDDMTITCSAPDAVFKAGEATAVTSITLSAKGMITFLCNSGGANSKFFVSGAGLS